MKINLIRIASFMALHSLITTTAWASVPFHVTNFETMSYHSLRGLPVMQVEPISSHRTTLQMPLGAESTTHYVQVGGEAIHEGIARYSNQSRVTNGDVGVWHDGSYAVAREVTRAEFERITHPTRTQVAPNHNDSLNAGVSDSGNPVTQEGARSAAQRMKRPLDSSDAMGPATTRLRTMASGQTSPQTADGSAPHYSQGSLPELHVDDVGSVLGRLESPPVTQARSPR
ncbi:hypothetical protein [Burkholderia contaminans]|uniref:hypothetical protein n=1 Tax=Burkholderia contaminans TaxID=488447 RepID=UPI0024175E0D|nr:hypothetical protein [Burkholderia contaminans]WFN14872.1 hypothetical protein LXE92_32030 [Burkholderia contaminans]